MAADPQTLGSRPGRRLAGLLLLLLPLFWGTALAGEAEDQRTGALKVAYLYHLTRFVQWPEESLGEDFVILVIGDPGLAAALDALPSAGKRVQGRPIVIQSRRPGEPIGDCQMLFIGAEAGADLPRLLAATAGRATLTVGDGLELAQQGVAIGLFRKPDILGAGERLRLAINPGALAGRGFEVSAQLYDVAEIVE